MDDEHLHIKLIRMPESIEYVANRAIWRLRGNGMKMPFFCCLKLSGQFDCIGVLHIGANL